RAQEAVHRGPDMTRGFFGKATLPVAIGDAHPFDVPALEIARDHPRSRLHDLADAAAALLAFAQPTAELVGEPGMFGPVMPTEGLVVRVSVRGDQLDGVFADLWTAHRHELGTPHQL